MFYLLQGKGGSVSSLFSPHEAFVVDRGVVRVAGVWRVE